MESPCLPARMSQTSSPRSYFYVECCFHVSQTVLRGVVVACLLRIISWIRAESPNEKTVFLPFLSINCCGLTDAPFWFKFAYDWHRSKSVDDTRRCSCRPPRLKCYVFVLNLCSCCLPAGWYGTYHFTHPGSTPITVYAVPEVFWQNWWVRVGVMAYFFVLLASLLFPFLWLQLGVCWYARCVGCWLGTYSAFFLK